MTSSPPPPVIRLLIVTLSLILISTALADAPSDNTIPTLAMRIRGSNASLKDITMELLCELSWLNFDAVNFSGIASNDSFHDLMSLCDSAGVYYSICPEEIMQYLQAWGDPEYRYWFRNSDESLTSDSCFARSNDEFDAIEQYTTAESLYYESDSISIRTTIVDDLAVNTDNHPFLWFYEVYDEANSKQGRHAVEDTLPWNDYVGLLAGTGYHVGNGWDRWSVIGPIDLKADTSLHWGTGTAKELWIRFQFGFEGIVPGSPEPIDVRIGWFRLEESAQ